MMKELCVHKASNAEEMRRLSAIKVLIELEFYFLDDNLGLSIAYTGSLMLIYVLFVNLSKSELVPK